MGTATKSLGKTLLEAQSGQVGSTKSIAKLQQLDVSSDISVEFQVHRDVLGSGASSIVYAATSRSSGKAVAVKRVRKEELDCDELRRLREEVKLHSRVRHPGIVELMATFESARSLDLVVERLDGGELLDHVNQQGRLSEETTAQVVLQILRILGYLHAQHVVHRDLKLENLVYECREAKVVKLIDFGLATECKPGRKLMERCGTPQYVAPEVLLGEPYDERADLWSLGVVAYAMLTGEALFQDENDIARQLHRRELQCCNNFKRVSTRAQEFTRALLSFDPRHRPAARQAIAHPWLRRVAPVEAAQTLRLVVLDNDGGSPTTRKGKIFCALGVGILAIGFLLLRRSAAHASA